MPFDFRHLTEAVQKVPGAPGLLQKVLFKERNCNPATILQFDEERFANKIVPYTTSIKGGTILEHTRRKTSYLEFPKLRPKKKLDANKILSRSAGAAPYIASGQNVAQSAERHLAIELQDIRRRLDLTIEKACADVVQGSLAIADTNLTYDFGMDSSHKITLATASKWTADTSNPNADIEAWTKLIKDDSGFAPDIIIMGTSAWLAFIAHDEVKETLDNRRIDSGMLAPDFAADFKGIYNGLQVYTYGGTFYDAADTAQEIWPVGKVALFSSKARTSLEFGLIEDLDAGIGGVQGEFFSKMWIEKDPSALWLLGETDPLPVTYVPESIVVATVL